MGDLSDFLNFATSATYTAWGSLVGVKYGVTGGFTGIVTSNSFNQRLQPSILSAAAPSQTVLSLSYDFGLGTNNNGDVYGFTNNRDTNRSVTYTYDQLNRVTSGQTTSNQWGTSYQFDIWGNLLQKTPITGKLSGENLVQAVQTNNQLVGCGYDAAGNQTTDCLGNTIAYDAENRVVTAAGVTYTYDGDGVRVKKSSGKIYWGALTESDLSGNNTADFVFFGGQRIARVDLPSGTVHYFFTDRLTSIGVVTNATGTTIEQEVDHRPFGEESIVANSISDQNFRFMGKERDLETGYDFFGARYYNYMSGRWLSADWTSSPSAVPYATLTNPQTLNLYAFVQNNPATNIELDGHMQGVADYVHHGEWHYAMRASRADGSENSADGYGSTGSFSDNTEYAEQRELGSAYSGTGQSSGQAGAADSQAQQTTGRQSDGSYVAPTGPGSDVAKMNAAALAGKPVDLVGSGECVALTSRLTGVTEDTSKWQRGPMVVNPDGTLNSAVRPGTAIATFDANGKYPKGNVDKNSATFLGPGLYSGKGSIRVIDQWNAHPNAHPPTPPHPPSARDVRFYADSTRDVSNNSNAYYVIIVPR